MPTENHAVPPPRRRPLGRGGTSGATGAAPTTATPVPPPGGDPADEPTADRPVGPQASGGPEEPRPSRDTAAVEPPERESAPWPGVAPDAPDREPAPSPDGADRLAVPPEADGPAGDLRAASAEDVTVAPRPAGAEPAGPQPAGGEAAAAGGGKAGGAPQAVVPAARGAVEAEPAREEPEGDDGRFTVVLDNFEGPFDLLLQLISKHKMDVTEVALSRVTDEFMAHIRAMGPDWDLDQTTEFLVVAATLLDLKAARLLPAAEVEDEADLAMLEARDLLFARLLQYRAYKQVADIFAGRLASESHRHPRTVGLEPHHAELLPEVILSIGPEGFAKLAVKAMQAKPKPQVFVDHIHAPLVSVREQAEIVVARLRSLGAADFAALTGDAADTLTVVARFLALLELYRERAVVLDQEDPLGALTVRWCGDDEGGTDPVVTDEFDQETAPALPEEGASR